MSPLALAPVFLGLTLLAAPAQADPAVSFRLPVIAAASDGNEVAIRMPRGDMRITRATQTRKLTIVALDAQGRVLESTTTTVSRRLTYASAKLSPLMKAAARIEVKLG